MTDQPPNDPRFVTMSEGCAAAIGALPVPIKDGKVVSLKEEKLSILVLAMSNRKPGHRWYYWPILPGVLDTHQGA